MLRVVLDTNVLVSALISTGKPREVWIRALEGNFTPVTSVELLAEFLGVVERKKFEDVGRNQVKRFARQLIRGSVMTTVKSRYKVVNDDPEDDIVINTAYSRKARYIVTGDSHLLRVGRFKGIRMVDVDSSLQLL